MGGAATLAAPTRRDRLVRTPGEPRSAHTTKQSQFSGMVLPSQEVSGPHDTRMTRASGIGKLPAAATARTPLSRTKIDFRLARCVSARGTG